MKFSWIGLIIDFLLFGAAVLTMYAVELTFTIEQGYGWLGHAALVLVSYLLYSRLYSVLQKNHGLPEQYVFLGWFPFV